MRFSVLASVLVVIPIPALAANWVKVASSETGTVIYVDIENVQNKNLRFVTAWVKSDFTGNRTERARERKSLTAFECVQRQSATVSTLSYRANGEVFDSETVPYSILSWSPVVPDTVGEALLQFVCSLAGSEEK